MYRFETNKALTECKIFKVSRIKNIPDKLIGTLYLNAPILDKESKFSFQKNKTYMTDGLYTIEYEENVHWLPYHRALAELGVITKEEANLKELGF